MNELFQACVNLLIILADHLGMTYQEVNIWIFVIIEPLIFFIMLLWIIKIVKEKADATK